jgi:hypothetical protein
MFESITAQFGLTLLIIGVIAISWCLGSGAAWRLVLCVNRANCFVALVLLGSCMFLNSGRDAGNAANLPDASLCASTGVWVGDIKVIHLT